MSRNHISKNRDSNIKSRQQTSVAIHRKQKQWIRQSVSGLILKMVISMTLRRKRMDSYITEIGREGYRTLDQTPNQGKNLPAPIWMDLTPMMQKVCCNFRRLICV